MVPRQNHRLQAPDSGDEEEKEELFRRQQQLLLTHQAEVQYETLLSDVDLDKPLTEFVELGQIWPVPPDDNVDRPFEPGNKVDAFHLDAWWPGVVIKREEDEYTVAFMYPPDLLVVRRSELRSHWDLADGVWVRAKKEMMMGSNFSPGTAVEMSPNEERLFYAWFPAIYLGQLGMLKLSYMAIRFGLSLQIRLKEILACWIKLMHSMTWVGGSERLQKFLKETSMRSLQAAQSRRWNSAF